MTFNGDTIIGRPTLTMVEIFIAEKGLFCEPIDAYEYWERKGWLTEKNREPKTLESAICSYNGIVVNRAAHKMAKELGVTKSKKKGGIKRIRKAMNAGCSVQDQNTTRCKHNVTDKRELMRYDEQLKDKRWRAFRTFVFAVRGKKCEMCGNTNFLQVHHPRYKTGHLAWEYTCNEVQVLCGECHRKKHNIGQKVQEG